MLLLGVFVGCLCFLSYAYVGVAFWRIHKETFLRLSIYDLTQQTGLIENFGDNFLPSLRALNLVALDTLSFVRLFKLFLGWPFYALTFKQALDFANYSSKILGDEKTESLRQDLLDQGFPQADPQNLKRKDLFNDGFLIRRLDQDLVSVFWHSRQAPAVASEWPSKVVAFKVPTTVRVKRLQDFMAKRGSFPYWAHGTANSALPYVVIYEPFSFGKGFHLTDVFRQAVLDFVFLKNKAFAPGPLPFSKITDSKGANTQGDLRAEQAFARFLRSTGRLQKNSDI